jgi:type VI secretion system protein ImpM
MKPPAVIAMAEQSAGYFGKIPSRGDFVSAGLASAVVRTWDRFVSAALVASKVALAERWSDIWLEAPVWRFALPAAMCGPVPLMGLWMPSVDQAGRQFPLMICAGCPAATPEQMVRHGAPWLDLAEDAGRAAIADDLTPERLAALIPGAPDLTASADTGLPFGLQARPGAALWWTEGAPLVPPQALMDAGHAASSEFAKECPPASQSKERFQ